MRLPKLNRLFYRILLCFLSLLIPILIVGSVTYYNFLQKTEKDYTEKMTSSLRSSAGAIDIYLKTVQVTSHSFFKDTVVGNLLKPDFLYTPEERADMVNLLASLSSTQSIVADLVENIFVYIDTEKVYTPSGRDEYPLYFGKINRYDAYPAEFWEGRLDSDALFEILKPTVLETMLHRKDVLPIVTHHLIKGFPAALVANVSIDTLRDTVKDNAVFGSTRYLVFDGEGGRVFETGFPGFTEDEADAMKTALAEQGADVGSYRLNGTSYRVSVVKSDMFGWTYYAFTPVGEFSKQAEGILNLVLTICAVLIVIGFAFSFFFTFKLYNPIRKIREILMAGERETGEEEGGGGRINEWEWIGSGIHKLIEHNQSFKSKLKRMSVELTDHFIAGYLRGHEAADKTELNTVFADIIGFRRSGYQICAILFEYKQAFYTDIPEADRAVIAGKMKKLVRGLLEEYADCYVLETKPNLFVCIFNVEPERSNVRESLQHLMAIFRYDSLYCKVFIGVGTLYNGTGKLIESFREAMAALLDRQADGDFQMIEAKARLCGQSYAYSYSDEHKVLNALKAGDPLALAENVESIIGENERRNVSLYGLNALISELYNTGLRYLSEFEYSYDSVATDEEHLQLSDAGELPLDWQAKKAMLLRIYGKMSSIVADRRKEAESAALVASVNDYIDSNYDKDIYLEKISLHLNVSAKYISRAFKEKTGTNVTDVISIKRIAKAKELLERTDMSVGEISEAVGIYSRSTFLRIFKKLEGVSPNDYRKIRS